MSETYWIDIGGEQTLVGRHLMCAHEAAFVWRTTAEEVRDRVALSLFPVVNASGNSRIDAAVLSDRLVAGGDWLAVEFLRAWCEGRFEAPSASDHGGFVPNLADCLVWLDQPALGVLFGEPDNEPGFAGAASPGSLCGETEGSDSQRLAAKLFYSKVTSADLSYANLSYADLNGSDLTGAILKSTNFSHANLLGATLTLPSLDQGLLDGATMPDGTIHN